MKFDLFLIYENLIMREVYKKNYLYLKGTLILLRGLASKKFIANLIKEISSN